MRRFITHIVILALACLAVSACKDPEPDDASGEAQTDEAPESSAEEDGNRTAGEGTGQESGADTPEERSAGKDGAPREDDDAKSKSDGPTFRAADPDDPLREKIERAQAKLDAEKAATKGDWPLGKPRTQKELRTTSCKIYLGNLEARLRSAEKLVEKHPDHIPTHVDLAVRTFGLGQIRGDLDQMQRGVELLDAVLEEHPDQVGALLQRARMHQSLHRFGAAREDLERAAELEPKNARVAARERELAFATSPTPEVLEAMQSAYEDGATYDNYVTAAKAHLYVGNDPLADRYFGLAERSFRGVAPIPLAWLNVQRGLMAMHNGDDERAHTFFEVGYERCPEYPMAAEHLAEIEGRLGNTERAVELYEAVIEATDEPEFMAALADVHREAGRADAADALIERADARYRALLKKHPEAMYWHAAGFFLGSGEDPELARKLLEKNLALRPNARSYQALAEAQLATGDVEAAAASIEAALKRPGEFAEKYWTAARVATARGNAKQAAVHATKARELNPEIEDHEGPLE